MSPKAAGRKLLTTLMLRAVNGYEGGVSVHQRVPGEHLGGQCHPHTVEVGGSMPRAPTPLDLLTSHELRHFGVHALKVGCIVAVATSGVAGDARIQADRPGPEDAVLLDPQP